MSQRIERNQLGFDNRGLPTNENIVIKEVYLHVLQSHNLIEPLRSNGSEEPPQVGCVVQI